MAAVTVEIAQPDLAVPEGGGHLPAERRLRLLHGRAHRILRLIRIEIAAVAKGDGYAINTDFGGHGVGIITRDMVTGRLDRHAGHAVVLEHALCAQRAKLCRRNQTCAQQMIVEVTHEETENAAGETLTLPCIRPPWGRMLAVDGNSGEILWETRHRQTPDMGVLTTAGLPPEIADWDDFEDFMGTLVTSGVIRSVKEVWWDIRPHPTFGTDPLESQDAVILSDLPRSAMRYE